MSDQPKNPKTDSLDSPVKASPHAKGPKAHTPRAKGEQGTLSANVPQPVCDMLDSIGDTLHTDRSAVVRMAVRYFLRAVLQSDGTLVIPDAVKSDAPFAIVSDYMLQGLK